MSGGTTPQPEDLRVALAESWTHARHQEHQREFFVRLYVVLVVAALAYLEGNLAGNRCLLFVLAMLGVFGILFTLKTTWAFDNQIKAGRKIAEQLHLDGLVAWPIGVDPDNGTSRIVKIVRVRYLYLALYSAIVIPCLVVCFLG